MMKKKNTESPRVEKKSSSFLDRKKRLQRIKEAAARNRIKHQWPGEVVAVQSKGMDVSSGLEDELTFYGDSDIECLKEKGDRLISYEPIG
jgi:hypothetical protein